jgi:hypothetical protein
MGNDESLPDLPDTEPEPTSDDIYAQYPEDPQQTKITDYFDKKSNEINREIDSLCASIDDMK